MSIRLLPLLLFLVVPLGGPLGRVLAGESMSAAEILAAARLSDGQHQRLNAGYVVSGDRDDLGDESLAIVLLKRVPLPVPEAHEALIRANIAQNAVIGARIDPIEEGSFPRIRLGDDELRRLQGFRGGHALNFGSVETGALRKLVAETEVAGPAVRRSRLERWLQDTIEGRYVAYATRGIDGILPYKRGDEMDDPTKAFERLRAGTLLPCPGFDRFCRQLDSHPRAVDGIRHQYWLMTRQVDGRDHLALVHRMADERPDFVVAIEREFYSLHTFKLQQFVFVVVPDGPDVSLVAIVADTFTHRVGGFGGSVARWVGRKLLRDQMASLLEPLP